MKKNNGGNRIEGERAFAANLYRDRAAINRKAQEVLQPGRAVWPSSVPVGLVNRVSFIG